MQKRCEKNVNQPIKTVKFAYYFMCQKHFEVKFSLEMFFSQVYGILFMKSVFKTLNFIIKM